MPYFPAPENSPDTRTLAVYFFGGGLSISLIYSAYSKIAPPENTTPDPKAAAGFLAAGLILATLTYFAARWTAHSEY